MKNVKPVTSYQAPEYPAVKVDAIVEHDCSHYDVCHPVYYVCDLHTPCMYYTTEGSDGCFCEDSVCECGNNGAGLPWL